MELLEILKGPKGYTGQNRNIPQEWKAAAQRLCWEYNQSAPDERDRRASILRQLLGIAEAAGAGHQNETPRGRREGDAIARDIFGN